MRYFISILVLAAICVATIACGGNNQGGQQQQDITVTVSPKTVSVAGDATQDFKATILNPNNRGVTWSVSGTGCTGSACGTIGNLGGNKDQGWTATYTAPLTVPSPASVTLSATSIDDKSKSDAAAITITPAVVTVVLAPTTATVFVGATQQFTATVHGDTNKDVTWSLSGPGTIDTDGLYTAPSSMHTPSTTTVTATAKADTRKSASVTITIPAVSMSLTPTTSRVVLGMTQQFAASVTNAANMGVTWHLGGPGSISSSGLYTAPNTLDNETTAQLTAVSQADPDVFRTMSITVAVTPTISPATVTVPAGGTQPFTADVPVTWQIGGVQGTDPATWGTITANGVYTAPLSPPWTGKVNIKATLNVDPRHSANSVTTVVFSNASLQGHYAFRYRGINSNVTLFGVGSVQADGKGGISSGSLSFSQSGTSTVSASVTGTYSVKPDGKGSATFNFQQGGGQQQFPIHFVLTSNTAARILGFDDTGTGWGNLDLQTGLTTSTDLSGRYVVALDGFRDNVGPVAMAGMFNAGGGTISSGIADLNDNGSIAQNVAFAGTYSPLQPYLPSTANLNVGGLLAHFIFYQLSPDVLILISGNEDVGYLGVAIHQDTSTSFSNNSLSGNLLNVSTGYEAFEHQDAVALGRFTADGFGNLTDGVIDNIVSHPTWASSVGYKMSSTATYSIQANGRGTMTLYAGGGVNILSTYMVAPNQLLYICLSPNYSVSTGQLLPQASGTYDQSLIRGSWAVNLRETYYYWPGKADVTAQIASDGAGNLTGTADVNAVIEDGPDRSLVPDSAITGIYTMDANGRGEATLNFNSISTEYAIYAASGRALYIVPIDSSKWASLGLGARQF